MSNFQKNSKDYGEPDITYQLAGSAEQRPLGPWDACLSKNHDGTTQQIDDAVGISSKTNRHQVPPRLDDETGATEH